MAQSLRSTSDSYKLMARIAESTMPKVRNAIEIAWTRGNTDTIREYFGYTAKDFKGKPSNLEFVAMMAQRALTYVKK